MTATSPPNNNPPPVPRFHISLFQGLRGVKSADLPKEIIAGITLAALMVPLNIGYAQVAGLPPIVGLYTAILPMIAFAIFCSSRQLTAGPDAPIAALIGAILLALAAPSDPRYVQLAYALALLCGVVFFVFWFFKLGFLANFLSKAVLIGFVTGLGIEVFTSQMKKIMGVSIESEGWIREVIELITKIPVANWYCVAIGVGSVAVIRLLKRYAPAIPGALVALILSTVIVAVFQLDQKGVSVLGAVPAGLPSLVIPQVSFKDYLSLLPGALAICGVTLADGLLVGRNYAQKNGYKIDANEEMFAFGAGNIASALTGGFTLGSSASRTAAMDGTGSRSQIPSLVGAIVVAIVLLFFSNLLALLPNAALGGIVANAVLSLIEVKELRELFRTRRDEFYIAFVCLACVLLLGSLSAVIIAFLLSTIDILARASKPSTAVLGQVEGQRGFLSIARFKQAQTIPGLAIYRFGAQIFFANAQKLLEDAKHIVETTTPPVQTFVLDGEAIDDIDSTGAETLGQLLDYLKKKQVRFAMTRVAPEVVDALKVFDLLERIGEENLYPTNRDAVDAFQREKGGSPAANGGDVAKQIRDNADE